MQDKMECDWFKPYLDKKLAFEFMQILKPFKNEDIAVMRAKYNEIDIKQEKVFNMFLLPNKKG